MLAEIHVFDRLAAHASAEKRIYYGIAWRDYIRLLDELSDDSHIRLTFDHGVLEVMSPKALHEELVRLIDMIVTYIAFASGQNVKNCGAMTMRARQAERGGEPDSCFYIAHEPQVRGLDDIDLQVHPPPDIVLEIDITHPSLDKFGLYAAVLVPEVWRYKDGQMQFYVLGEDAYQSATFSNAFPRLSPAMIERYLAVGRTAGSSAMFRLITAELSRA